MTHKKYKLQLRNHLHGHRSYGLSKRGRKLLCPRLLSLAARVEELPKCIMIHASQQPFKGSHKVTFRRALAYTNATFHNPAIRYSDTFFTYPYLTEVLELDWDCQPGESLTLYWSWKRSRC